MTRLRRFTKEESRIFAEKIMELGNLVFIGLVIAQIVPTSSQFQFSLALLGMILISLAYLVAYVIMRKK